MCIKDVNNEMAIISILSHNRIGAAYCYTSCTFRCLCLCVCALGISVSATKTDEPIEMLFWGQTYVDPRKCIRSGVHWRQLVDTSQRSVRGGDAALCQITLATCLN